MSKETRSALSFAMDVPTTRCPKFNFSEVELQDLVKFIHAQAALAASHPGDAAASMSPTSRPATWKPASNTFTGPGAAPSATPRPETWPGLLLATKGCNWKSACSIRATPRTRSPSRYPSGETIVGTVEYQDEFTIGMRDSHGTYRSWPVAGLNYKIDSPVTAHVDQFPKYTDDDIHNLMAFIQTLKSPDASNPATATTHGDD